jgi:probable phosphoglycerate mutase
MGQVFLAKSAATDLEDQDRIVGTLDVPINVRGQAEVSDIARELAGVPIDTIYATASESARQTAAQLAKKLGVKVKELDELRNLDFGLWQGLPVAEVERKHRKLYSKWKESPCEACPPAGEEIGQVYGRVEKWIGPIIRRNSFRAVVIVAPDPLRRIIRCYLKDRKVDNVLLQAQGVAVECIPVSG